MCVMEPAHLASEHNLLVMRAGAYQNCCWVVGVAKAGTEDGNTGRGIGTKRWLHDHLLR